MAHTTEKLSPARQKLLKKYGSKKTDWRKALKSIGAFKGLKIDARKLRKEAWTTGGI